jgi:ribosomal protein S18 acetylase RimI-like enzyme
VAAQPVVGFYSQRAAEPTFVLTENMLRTAQDTDLTFLSGFTSGPRDDQLRAQVRDGRLRIIESAEGAVGFIKFYILWEVLPFIEVIIIREDCRGRGIGRAAIGEWEAEMSGRSFQRAIVSTQADETAQYFWRRIGYQDCGYLALPGRPVELLLHRDLLTREPPSA